MAVSMSRTPHQRSRTQARLQAMSDAQAQGAGPYTLGLLGCEALVPVEDLKVHFRVGASFPYVRDRCCAP